jgi:hypothetical protein
LRGAKKYQPRPATAITDETRTVISALLMACFQSLGIFAPRSQQYPRGVGIKALFEKDAGSIPTPAGATLCVTIVTAHLDQLISVDADLLHDGLSASSHLGPVPTFPISS